MIYLNPCSINRCNSLIIAICNTVAADDSFNSNNYKVWNNMRISIIGCIRSVSSIMLISSVVFFINQSSYCQVHYYDDGGPWNQKAQEGPDAEVDGWYYNLGITGLRVMLLKESPRHLLVKHVFKDSPANGKIFPDDLIIGANNILFDKAHKNGYGMDKFGPEGPILDFANAIESCQTKQCKGRLAIKVIRKGKNKDLVLKLGMKYGAYSKSFPFDCNKTDLILTDLYKYLLKNQKTDGSWGIPPHDTFAPLALLASGNKSYLNAVKKNVQRHARTTSAKDRSSLINWRYMAAAIVMSEYYHATREKWVLKELEEVYTFLTFSQYTNLTQVTEKVKETHPDAFPKNAMDSYGGWGHNPGFEGYGPISMLTGQGALAYSLMNRAGIKIERKRHDAAFDFLVRASGKNGYVWYEDQAAGQNDWADMGRTGATGIANQLSPYEDDIYKKRALAHAKVIGEHPESFPDTHGSPIMGMGYAAIAANIDKNSFRKLMDANRWWFTLAQCHDGSFYYQPNRDNAGYGADSRISASAVVAFIFSIPKANLQVTGKP